MFNFAYSYEDSRDTLYFRQTNHFFFRRNGRYGSHFDHHNGNWFPHNSKELDFDEEDSSRYFHAMSV